ncbi:hypothetical protein FB446DRAFT_45432 [Lentinula raphanica]|nr:hypothetical protein FB446DRAFT_45432 [Lentinula raphanica]
MQPPPFLPPRPDSSQPSTAQAAALSLRSALANPYSHAYSSHYAQAYMQQQYSNATITSYQSPPYPQLITGPSFSLPQNQINGGVRIPSYSSVNSSWYQTGNIGCTYKNCPFTGSAKSVEIHKMDRHLIYPPGWEKRKKNDWDADPGLKGKPIRIQGTNLVLDTPQAIEAWVAERKKRWPSNALIADKKRKYEEASARGELSVESLGLFSKKKQRLQNASDNKPTRIARGRGRGRGRGSWTPSGSSDTGWKGRGFTSVGTLSGHRREEEASLPAKFMTNGASRQHTPEAISTKDNLDGSSSDSDSEPEVQSSKPPSGEPIDEPSPSTAVPILIQPRQNPKQWPRQPKKLPHNPFAPKTSLLQKLLLPETQMTVSNLSQAIRFIVDNNFFDGVEFTPGEAAANPIQVISSETTPEPSSCDS